MTATAIDAMTMYDWLMERAPIAERLAETLPPDHPTRVAVEAEYLAKLAEYEALHS